ncbi:hypothetical protein [uncultured Microbulbifer sp.]|uniref:alpha/beta hydrolase n=1 Tax=uncultured Microbulbifer sp. TaxID=348147 RepID=UPI0025F073C0|nr:hypothetical protein [uncultured Microbulbifer sp.]
MDYSDRFFIKLLPVLLIAIFVSFTTIEAHAEPEKRVTKREDGSNIYWSIEHPNTDKRRGVLLIAQGSGCGPTTQNPTIASAKSIVSDYSVLLVEKYGVSHDDRPEDPMTDCSKDFFSHHTVGQRVADVSRVIKELKGSSWWSGELVLFGGSEGGAVVSRLTPLLRPIATVVFSSGPGASLAESLLSVIPPPAKKQANEVFKQARENPESTKMWGGNSYRWWADVVDDVQVKHLLKTNVPVLVVQGERDQFSPVESARAARRYYDDAGRCELTYWEFPDYDHFMTDSDGHNHRDEVFQKISKWIESTQSGSEQKCPIQFNGGTSRPPDSICHTCSRALSWREDLRAARMSSGCSLSSPSALPAISPSTSTPLLGHRTGLRHRKAQYGPVHRTLLDS